LGFIDVILVHDVKVCVIHVIVSMITAKSLADCGERDFLPVEIGICWVNAEDANVADPLNHSDYVRNGTEALRHNLFGVVLDGKDNFAWHVFFPSTILEDVGIIAYGLKGSVILPLSWSANSKATTRYAI
jgi:hypothetical protein